VSLVPPSDAPWGAVVIANLSPYLLEVQAGAAPVWLNPFYETMMDAQTTHAPVVINAQVVAGSTSTGAGSQVQATWYDPGETPNGAWPVSLTASAIAAALLTTPAPAGLVSSTFDPTSLFPVVVNFPSTTRTLLVTVSRAGGGIVTDMSITTNTTFQTLWRGVPYLRGGHPPPPLGGYASYTKVVNVAGAADSSVTIWIASGTMGWLVNVYADSTEFSETVFYNGVPVTAGVVLLAPGSTVLADGPCRLLSAHLRNPSAPLVGLYIGGIEIMGSAANGTDDLFPSQPYIVNQGESLTATQTGAGGSQATVRTAYP
jgi:hypothetical protein